eukprot:m.207859 g.207859  ORF g.207859 m.207859 type:complete len:308 (+) comp26077_c0_seq13:56-979(+)
MTTHEFEEFSAEKVVVDNNLLIGAEGPAFDRHGNFFCVAVKRVDEQGKPAGAVFQVNEQDSKLSILSEPNFNGHGGMPSGIQVDSENNLWVADMRHGLLKVTPKGETTQIATVVNGEPMRGCNDLVFDSKGNFSIAPAELTMSFKEAFGIVYCFPTDEDGNIAKGKVQQVASKYLFSNGIVVSRDDKMLIVAESFTHKLWAYDIRKPGQLENERLWAMVPGDHFGGPDGLKFDANGNLLVCNMNLAYIEVFNPTGLLSKRIHTPFAKVSNLAFKPGCNDLYVCDQINCAVWKIKWTSEGQKVYWEEK